MLSLKKKTNETIPRKLTETERRTEGRTETILPDPFSRGRRFKKSKGLGIFSLQEVLASSKNWYKN